MADTKISELGNAGALAGTETLPIVQGGSTVKTTITAATAAATAAAAAAQADATSAGTDADLALAKLAAVASLMPTGALVETVPREEATTNGNMLTSGRLQMVAIGLWAGLTITSISFVSSTTALSAGTNQWFGLFNSSREALRLTVDDTTTAWAARSVKTLALTSQYVVPTTGLYYLGVMVAATTVPTLACNPLLHADIGQIAPILTGSSTTTLTTPPALPFTAAAINSNLNRPYAWVS